MNDNACDTCALTLKELYDQYGACAGRLHDLIRRLQKREEK